MQLEIRNFSKVKLTNSAQKHFGKIKNKTNFTKFLTLNIAPKCINSKLQTVLKVSAKLPINKER